MQDNERVHGRPVSSMNLKTYWRSVWHVIWRNFTILGSFFTWTDGNIQSKIDRVLVNSIWQDGFPMAHAHFLLDVYLILRAERSDSRPSFKFFNIWSVHEPFLPTVGEVWSEEYEGTAMFQLCKKLKSLKKTLKLTHFSWSYIIFFQSR